MIIKKLTMEKLEVNNYFIVDENTNDAILIDAGGNFDLVEKTIKDNYLNLKYILNTHAHMDHIAGNFDIEKKFNVKSYLHKDDEMLLSYFKDSLQMIGMKSYNPPCNIEFFDGAPIFKLNNIEIKTINLPGHTKGGVGYLIEDNLFSGDTLFKECVGRTDLWGGDFADIQKSIKENIYTLNDNVKVYPGHGSETTVGFEKKYNCYVKG